MKPISSSSTHHPQAKIERAPNTVFITRDEFRNLVELSDLGIKGYVLDRITEDAEKILWRLTLEKLSQMLIRRQNNIRSSLDI